MAGHISFTDFIEQRTISGWTGRFFEVCRVNYRNSSRVLMQQWFLVYKMCEVRLFLLKEQLFVVILMAVFEVERLGYGLDCQGVRSSIPDKGKRCLFPA
jgi:hypothetical protein